MEFTTALEFTFSSQPSNSFNSTIFKTFYNDIDGGIYKIGILDKSFGEIRDNFKSWKQEFNNFAKNQTNANLSDFQKRIEALKNVGNPFSYIFGSERTIEDKTAKYAEFVKQVESSGKTAIECAANNSKLDISILEYVSKTKGAIGTTEEFTRFLRNNTISAKAAQLGWQALAVAGNMLASVAITAVVQGFYQLITLSHTVAEGAKEAGDAFNLPWRVSRTAIVFPEPGTDLKNVNLPPVPFMA